MKKILVGLSITFSLFVACKNSPKNYDKAESTTVSQHNGTTVNGKNGVAFTTAIQYNDFIVNKQTEIAKQIMQFASESQTDLSKAEQTINQAVTKVDESISDIKSMPDWEGNTALRDNALPLFKFYKTIFSEDYKRIIDMKKDDVISPDELTEYNQIMQRINSTEMKLDANFKTAQSEFASKNGFGVNTNELQSKIDEMKKGQ